MSNLKITSSIIQITINYDESVPSESPRVWVESATKAGTIVSSKVNRQQGTIAFLKAVESCLNQEAKRQTEDNLKDSKLRVNVNISYSLSRAEFEGQSIETFQKVSDIIPDGKYFQGHFKVTTKMTPSGGGCVIC